MRRFPLLPNTPERARQELALQLALGLQLVLTKGHAAPEVETTYTRARELCRQEGETSQLFSVLLGLRRFHFVRGQLQTAHEMGEQLLALAQRLQDTGALARAHLMVGEVLYLLGAFPQARAHAEQGLAFYDSQHYRPHIASYGNDTGVSCLANVAWALWMLGYPDQALKQSQRALVLAHELAHPFTLAIALDRAAWLHQFRREGQAAQTVAEALITLSTEQEFALSWAHGTILRGRALAEQGQRGEEVAQVRQGLAALQTTGAQVFWPCWLALLAETYEKRGQAKEGLTILTDALVTVDKIGERVYEAELYRLKGELTLQQSGVRSSQSEAEACFHQAIKIAQRQQAKSLELRATTSLARLWQQQGKQQEAHSLLSEIYDWFTEGFDTKDLQEAKALLEEVQQ